MNTTVNNTDFFKKVVLDTLSHGAHNAKEFIAQTPPEVISSTATGIFLQFFNTKLALPSCSVFIGCFFSRITLVVISKIRPTAAEIIIQRTNEFHEKFRLIPVIIWIAAVILSWFAPVAGIVVGSAVGLYYGAVAEKIRYLLELDILPTTNATPNTGL